MLTHDPTKSLRERFESPIASPADRLLLRSGTMADYAALGSFHYLRSRPSTMTRVLVLDDPEPTIASRFVAPTTVAPQPSVAAVLVESYPSLSCVLRDVATGGRYAGWRDRKAAARLLNAEVRCISRVVVHPQWRGLGLAVRLVRHALDTAETPYTEALAAMGRVHPFFKLAGMTAYRRHAHGRDQRLLDAMRHAGAATWELASEARMRRHVDASPLLARELRRWAGKASTIEQQITMARERLLCEPVYYIKRQTTID